MWEYSLWEYPSDKVWRYDGDMDYRVGQLVWKRYLFSDANVGVTGSSVITDPVSGELLAIVAVDYTMDWLSQTLSGRTTDMRGKFNYTQWKTWIFEKSIMNVDNDESGSGHVVVASSDGNLLIDAPQTEGCYGYLMANDQLKLPHDAEAYPDWLIRVFSREIPFRSTTH